ncbi:MAG: hypothetical protein EON97_00320 [Chitinophagaceae bacterium]|nr:MAG: hypothetical protein EON97_00320 [Chitinophagaceae bacterium]
MLVAALTLASCTGEEDIRLPDYEPLVFGEDFTVTADLEDTPVTIPGWENIAETGSVKWIYGYYSSNYYAEFTSYQSGEPSNIGWLVTKPVNMDAQDNEKMLFQVCQAYVDNAANTFQVLYTTDYTGDVATSTWTNLALNNPPLMGYDYRFVYFNQEIDLSQIEGANVRFAFKVVGNTTSLDGTYQMDNLRIVN